MTEQELFVRAQQSLKNVIDQIRDDQWGMVMPEEFSRAIKREITLRELVNYHAYDDAWVPDMLAGKTMDEVGKEAFKGDLLDGDPKGNYAKYNEAACAAALACTDLDRTVHMSYGAFKAREYFWHVTYFRGLRVYDLAKVIGVDTTMPEDLVQGLWDQLNPHAEEWRKIGVFGPRVEVPDDADMQKKLLGLVGRE